jgi:hypothetical protein
MRRNMLLYSSYDSLLGGRPRHLLGLNQHDDDEALWTTIGEIDTLLSISSLLNVAERTRNKNVILTIFELVSHANPPFPTP